MRILALESSCDDTSVAIVDDGRQVIASLIESQASVHAQTGGVVPEVAARYHAEHINNLVAQCLEQAQCHPSDIDIFAATLGPGLVGSLLVAAQAAKTLSLIFNKPFRGVNHLYGHIASNYLHSSLAPPFLCLLISGGHTQLIHVKHYNELDILGETLDDAVGEAYDKVARLLGLGYPGGPQLDAMAQRGNPRAYELPTARTQHPFDFSYSGLKTATLRLIERLQADRGEELSETVKRDVAASFQDIATRVLVKKTLAAADTVGCQCIAVAGGVAANSAIRQKFQTAVESSSSGLTLFLPDLAYCTDNAAMIASSAFYNPISDDLTTEVFSRTIA